MGVKDQFDATNFGIFAGSEGLSNVSEMDLEQSDEYYGMSRHCEGCGQRLQCQVDWAELYCLQYGINPALLGKIIGRSDVFDTSWPYDPKYKCFHPNYHCQCHGQPLVIFNMTPREAERVLHAAGKNGIISDEQKNVIRTIKPWVQRLAANVPAMQVAQEYQNALKQAAAQRAATGMGRR